MKKKLFLVGSNTVHMRNYIELVRDFFDEVLFVTSSHYDGCPCVVVDFSLSKPLNWIKTTRQIARAAKKFSPDIIHVHQANAFAWYTFRALKKYTVPKILTAWGSDILVNPKESGWLKRIVKYSLAQADFLTSDSVFMAGEMKKLLGGKKTEILIANFGIYIDLPDLPKQKIVYSNRLHSKVYRIDEVIKAFHRFLNSEKGKDWKMVIAATGEETPALTRLIAQLGIQDRVEMAGWVNKEQNTRFYATASIFISIPESDATAISLLEAMASKCIPVVSDLPANREWITDGVNGIVAGNLNEDFISRVFELDWEKAIEKNVATINEHGTREASRKKFIELYQKALSA